MDWNFTFLRSSILLLAFISQTRAFTVLIPGDPAVSTLGNYYTVSWDTAQGDATVWLYKGWTVIDEKTTWDASWTLFTRTGDPGSIIDKSYESLSLEPGDLYWFSVKNDAGDNWSRFFKIEPRPEEPEPTIPVGFEAPDSPTPAVPGETASAATPTTTSFISSSPLPSPATNSQKSSSDTGIIVGGVIGGIALIGILVLGGIYMIKWAPSRNQKGMATEKDEEMPMPKPPGLVFEHPEYIVSGTFSTTAADSMRGRGNEYSPSYEIRHEFSNDGMRHELSSG